MFKTDLPPDSSWKWDVKVYEDPLPTGRYVLADDYKKLQEKLEEKDAEILKLKTDLRALKILKE